MNIVVIVILITLLVAVLYVTLNYYRSKNYFYESPASLTKTMKSRLLTKNPSSLIQLRNDQNINRMLSLKAEAFFNLCLLGLQTGKERKIDFYENLIEVIKLYLAYFLLYVDLNKESEFQANWPLLDNCLRDLYQKIDEIEPILASAINHTRKNQLYDRQITLQRYFADIRSLKHLLFK